MASLWLQLGLLFLLLPVGQTDPAVCDGGSCKSAPTMFGTELLLDSHTVILGEGTEEEVKSPDWFSRFKMTNIAEEDNCEVLGWRERESPRLVWDAFTFFNELDVLRLRLDTLYDVVDRFVLVEATKTHSNLPKGLVFEDAKGNFSSYLPKILHVVVDDMPDSNDSWVLEHFQRNAILRGLRGAIDNDIVIVGDLDEIPNPHTVHTLKQCEGWDESGPVQFYTRFYNFKFSWQFEALWYHPQAALFSWIKVRSPQDLRFARTRPPHLRIEDAGWHLSFFADAQGIITKMKAYAHQEFNVPDMLNSTAIDEAIREGKDYFYAGGEMKGRFGQLFENPSCHGLPKPAMADKDRYGFWLPACEEF